MAKLTTREDALRYHSEGRPGKIQVVPTKPCLTQIDLSLAYTPGVAEPCREIAKDPEAVYRYTARGNLVAVVSDGSAVLGLGNIGPLGAKPVMEGKGVLFKRFADIDVFDIELGTQDTDEIVAAVKALEPTVAGINLEDISAPRCFEIEQRLREELSIPVFHDDQHGTAIIAGAALLNALELAQKRIEDVRVVVNGAGAAAVACADYVITLGVRPEHVLMCDSGGVIYAGRTERMNPYKQRFAVPTERRTLADAMEGADVFFGVSVGGTVDAAMVRSMAPRPILFAMANPDPEILPEDAHAARPDVIMATGRSDYPNQVNNVLGFPFIFRGALDARASRVTPEMMHAATRALAELAREPVPREIAQAYGLEALEFGPGYLIPKPLDPRLLPRVARAVAGAAMESGVARRTLDLDVYERELRERLGPERDLMRRVVNAARRDPRRIVFPEGAERKTLIAAQAIVREGIAHPVLVGEQATVHEHAEAYGVSLEGIEVLQPDSSPHFERYVAELIAVRRHRGRLSDAEARELVRDPMWFSALMVRLGEVDGMVAGVTRQVRKTIGPIIKTVPLRPGVRLACGMSLLITSERTLFLADTSVNIEPSAEDLAEIALLAAEAVRKLGIEPIVALVSFSSYGGSPHPRSDMVRRAVELARKEAPTLVIDGEMRVDAALDPIVQGRYPQSRLGGKRANVLVFPNLEAANIAFNLVRTLTDASVIGPMMLGLDRPAHVLQPHSSDVLDLIHLCALAVLEAQERVPAAPVG